jgi:uncharacterized protein
VRLDATNLRDLARACGLLAAGVGGDLEVGLLMALVAVAAEGPVEVIGLDELPDDALVLPCGCVGAQQLADERVFSGDEGGALTRAFEDLRGARVAALMCFEVAGPGGLLPVAWAARAGLPLVDADGAGRSFPYVHQRTMHVAGVPASPVILTDGRGNDLVFRTADDQSADRLARGAASALGGVAAAAAYGMAAGLARRSVIPGAISRALELGRAVDSSASADSVAQALGATVLIEGHVTGREWGSATIDGFAREPGRQLRLELRDGFLVAFEEGAVKAAIPDLILVLAGDGGTPVAAGALRRGERVTVLAAPAHGIWKTDRGLAVASPRAFGYDVD